jgi:hypothetical protein
MTYQYIGGYTGSTNGSGVFTQSVSVPAGFIVVIAAIQNAGSPTVAIGATSLHADVTNTDKGVSSNSGALASSGTAVTLSGGGGSSLDASFGIWQWTGTGTATATGESDFGAGGVTLSGVLVGDYCFAGCFAGSSVNFNGSTQTPNNVGPGTPYTITGGNGTVLSLADWTITSAGSFQPIASLNQGIVGADYTRGGGAVDDVAPRSAAATAITLMRDRAGELLKPMRKLLVRRPGLLLPDPVM